MPETSNKPRIFNLTNQSKSMKIEKYIGTTSKEVESKKYNIWIGISLRNKYFTKENIEKYILWALNNTKEDILIIIADRIEAINIEVLDKYTKLRAFRTALRKGDAKEKEIKEIISKLSEEKQRAIKIIRWREVNNTKYHDYRIEVLFEEFKKMGEFYNELIKMTKNHWSGGRHTLTLEKLERLAEYYIYEIPLFLNGAKFGGLPEKGGKTYLLQIYPGLGEFDEFLMDLQEGKRFPELTKKLKITDKFAMVSAFCD